MTCDECGDLQAYVEELEQSQALAKQLIVSASDEIARLMNESGQYRVERNISQQQVKGLREALRIWGHVSWVGHDMGSPSEFLAGCISFEVGMSKSCNCALGAARALTEAALSASAPVAEEHPFTVPAETKQAIREGHEDYKAGRTRPWSEIRKELDIKGCGGSGVLTPVEEGGKNVAIS